MSKYKKAEAVEIKKPKQSIYLDNKDVDNILDFKVNEKVVVKGYGRVKSVSHYQEEDGDRYTMSVEFDNIKVLKSDLTKIEQARSLKELKQIEQEI
ncbi:MAG: hypothetical protein IKO48_07185 [Elusimicrobia bacterium]|nr:hypothetical protein [Elusimicrobiota bacterium]